MACVSVGEGAKEENSAGRKDGILREVLCENVVRGRGPNDNNSFHRLQSYRQPIRVGMTVPVLWGWGCEPLNPLY